MFRFGAAIVRNGHYFNPVMASNLLGVITILARAGFDENRLVEAAARVKPATGRRFEVFRRGLDSGEQILVDDSYNANESSFREALTALRALLPSGRLALAAGPMAELGDRAGAAHRRLGELAAELDYHAVVLESPHMLEFVRAYQAFVSSEGANSDGKSTARIEQAGDQDGIIGSMRERIVAGEFDGILVKGSRGARMDIVADGIKELGYV